MKTSFNISSTLSNCMKCFVVSPLVFPFLLFASVIWLLLEAPHLLPSQPVPPPFTWHPSLSRNVSAYMKFGIETAVLNLEGECAPDVKILFIVPSSVNNTQRREAIRNSWGMWITDEVLEEDSLKMKLIFMLGKDLSWEPNKVSSKILKESDTYQDIVVEDFVDSYTNLTLKSVFILKWITDRCQKVDYVVKADDDMFINVPNLLKFLEKVKPPIMLGNLICNARPVQNRWSKWYTPSYMFAGKYPNYLSGTAYVLSGDIVKKLLTTAIQTPYFHLEDVYLTGICARKLGIQPTSAPGFSYVQRPFNPCVFDTIISSHEVSPPQMNRMWNMLHNQSVMVKCSKTTLPKKVINPSIPEKCRWL